MAIQFSVDLFPFKLFIFRLVITYIRTSQITPFLSKYLPGEHAPGPPSNSVTTQWYGATYTLALLFSF